MKLFSLAKEEETIQRAVYHWVSNFKDDPSEYALVVTWLQNAVRRKPGTERTMTELLRLPGELSNANLEACESKMLTILDNWINMGGELGGQAWQYKLDTEAAKKKHNAAFKQKYGKDYSRPPGADGEHLVADYTDHSFRRYYRSPSFILGSNTSQSLKVEVGDYRTIEEAARRVFHYLKMRLVHEVSIDDPDIAPVIEMASATKLDPTGYSSGPFQDSNNGDPTCRDCGAPLLSGDPILDYASAQRVMEILAREADHKRSEWEKLVTPERLQKLLETARADVISSTGSKDGPRDRILQLTLRFLNRLIAENDMESPEGIDRKRWWKLASPGVHYAKRDLPCPLNQFDGVPLYDAWAIEVGKEFGGMTGAIYQAVTRLIHDPGCVGCKSKTEGSPCMLPGRLRKVGPLDHFFVFIGHTPVPHADTCTTRQTKQRIDALYKMWFGFGPPPPGSGNGDDGDSGGGPERPLCEKCAAVRERFVRGDVSPSEAKAFREHVSQCVNCYAALQDYIEDLQTWGQSVNPKTARLREQYRALVSKFELPEKRPSRRINILLPSLATGLAVLAIALLVWPRGQDHRDTSAQLAKLERQLTDAKEQLAAEPSRNRRSQSAESGKTLVNLQRQLDSKQAEIQALQTELNRPPATKTQSGPKSATSNTSQSHLTKPSQSETHESERSKGRLRSVGENIYQDNSGTVFVATKLDPGDEQGLATAIRSGSAPIPAQIKEWNVDEAVLGSESPSALDLVGPVNTNILATTPLFRWKPIPTATVYRLTLQSDGRIPIATVVLETKDGHAWSITEYGKDSSATLDSYTTNSGTVWNPAHSGKIPSFVRGQTYSWWVDVPLGANPNAGAKIESKILARFAILSQKEADDIERARAQYSDSHLLMGIVYAKAGLLNEARQELRPEADQPLVKKILESLPGSK